MEQAEKSAAKSEAECGRRFGLEKERRVVQPQLFHRVAKVFVLCRIDRIQPRKNHRLYFLKSGKRLGHGPCRVGDRVADLHVGDGLDRGGQKADLAGPKLADRRRTRAVNADGFNQILAAGVEELDLRALS